MRGVRDASAAPRSRARRTFFFIDSPSVATTRPQAMAASAICWMRWMWLAKLDVMMRRPCWSANSARSTAPTCRSLGRVAVLLGVGRVGQQQPDALGRGDRPDAGEVGAPAVDRGQVELEVARVQDHALRACGRRWRARAGTEWVTGMNSTSNGPIARPLAVGHRHELGAAEEPGLLDAVAGQAERQRRAVDRERAAPAAGSCSAPTWSSWPWVATQPTMRSACSRR